jgi:hypothetical protein
MKDAIPEKCDVPPGYADVLVSYPGMGSLWLSEAYLVATEEGDYVVGVALDDSGVGTAYYPDDYTGQEVTMNFPATCIRKVGPHGGPLLHKKGQYL